MVAAAWAGAADADRVLLVIDAAARLGDRVETMLAGLEGNTQPLMIVLNKVDIARKEDLLTLATALSERLSPQATFMVSATTGDGVTDLKRALADATPAAPWHFPADQLSDATDRMVAAELTREQIYQQLHAERLMHGIGTEKWKDRRADRRSFTSRSCRPRQQKAIVLWARADRAQ